MKLCTAHVYSRPLLPTMTLGFAFGGPKALPVRVTSVPPVVGMPVRVAETAVTAGGA